MRNQVGISYLFDSFSFI